MKSKKRNRGNATDNFDYLDKRIRNKRQLNDDFDVWESWEDDECNEIASSYSSRLDS